MIGAFELGIIYAVVALGVYLTFRVLNFPDLTVDGSFTTGGATGATLITLGLDPITSTLIAFLAGAVAGSITGLLHTKGKIDGLLAGILTMIGLWSVNLRLMGLSTFDAESGTGISPGLANVSLLRSDTVFTPLREAGMLGTWFGPLLLFIGVFVLKLIIDWFLATDRGLALQATGNNEQMIRSLGANTDNQKILGLALSNGLVAAGGSLVAQYQGFADISMGVGLILIGLASVIIGQAFFGNNRVWLATLGVIVGALLYRLIIFVALTYGGLNPNDMKLITAIIVIVALLLPRFGLGGRLSGLFRTASGSGTKPPTPDAELVAPAAAASTAPASEGGQR
ncbi:ABC transporter permease [Gulosibacter molinativorax]|uniref:ABC transporter permease n=1 Tax=Gulosibacter molinativorax TaxID=256821 RepID=A0ABT7C7H9_9MICO|nr:ABC transporter permease [Gulosibacter molinativorax]MDJ1370621.1 ABC transporter permease [Gulosibacter molinativorax]QUY61965.1 Branched-chain amino acid transport system / permease component family protein [Gulosibacter molinativorax]